MSFSTDQETLSLKLLLMGDSGSGKTSILLRFCDDEFFGNEAATIGNEIKFIFI